jgi:putative transposase
MHKKGSEPFSHDKLLKFRSWLTIIARHAGNMPRVPRLSLPGFPLHVVQRGNNRQDVFFHQSGYTFYLDKLFESANLYDVSVHAYVCMTNHVHILATPVDKNGISQMMQRLGSMYTAGVNALNRRTGSLWEGRFRSSLIDSDRYCLACYRYIELNPVRAGLVDHPADYRWSSYRSNALGKRGYPLQLHPEWLALGHTRKQCRKRYADLVDEQLSPELMGHVRYGVRKGLPTGSSQFKTKIEQALNIRLSTGRCGRPKKGL